MKDEKLLMSRREAAAGLGVSEDTVARLMVMGELGVVRIGRSVLIPTSDVIALIGRGGAATGRKGLMKPGGGPLDPRTASDVAVP